MTAYFIVDYHEITDPQTLGEYREQVTPTLEQYGGAFLVRGGATQTIEGEWSTPRLVVLAFDDVESFYRWYHSPEYSSILPLRLKASRARAILVQGV
jgi:uncharacterized protein (DUF1330 family)